MTHKNMVKKYIEIAEKYGFKFYAVRNKYYPTELFLKVKSEINENIFELVKPWYSANQSGLTYWYASVAISEYIDKYGELTDKEIIDLCDMWLKINAFNKELNAVNMPRFVGNGVGDDWFYNFMSEGYKEIGKRFVIKN